MHLAGMDAQGAGRYIFAEEGATADPSAALRDDKEKVLRDDREKVLRDDREKVLRDDIENALRDGKRKCAAGWQRKRTRRRGR